MSGSSKRKTAIPASAKRRPPTPARSAVSSHRTAPARRAPETANATTLLGLADLRRNGGAAIENVATTGKEQSFSSSKTVPQIRFRPASLHPDLVQEIPEENRVLLKVVTSNLTQYRALVIVGTSFLVTSGRHAVIMDRHPDCPCEIVEARMKAWRAEVRAGAHASTRRHAKRAATTGEETLEFVRRAAKAQEERDAARTARDQRIIGLLEKILEKGGTLTPADRTLLERLKIKEGADACLADCRRPRERDLDRTMLD